MKLGFYLVRPPWWAILSIAIIVALLASLGVWQIKRAQYKHQLVQEHAQAEQAGPQPMKLTPADVKADNSRPRHGYHYIATGHYDTKHQLLLDDQIQGTQAGYRVWTPLILDSGVKIMVDRGWIERPEETGQVKPDPDAPDGKITIKGYWTHLPQPGIRFSNAAICNRKAWPRAFSYPSLATVRCQYEAPVANGLLLLDPEAQGGFVRDWEEDAIGLKPWVHYAYAAQWFLLVILVIAFLLFITSRRRR